VRRNEALGFINAFIPEASNQGMESMTVPQFTLLMEILHTVVASRAKAKVYFVERQNNIVIETPLKAKLINPHKR